MGNGAMTQINSGNPHCGARNRFGAKIPKIQIPGKQKRFQRRPEFSVNSNVPIDIPAFELDLCRELLLPPSPLAILSQNPLRTVSPSSVSVNRRITHHTELQVNGATGPFANKINGVYELNDTIAGSRILSPGGNTYRGEKIYYKCNNQPTSPSNRNRDSITIRYTRMGYWIVVQTSPGHEELVLASTAKSMLTDPDEATKWFVRRLVKSKSAPVPTSPPRGKRRRSMKEFLDLVAIREE